MLKLDVFIASKGEWGYSAILTVILSGMINAKKIPALKNKAGICYFRIFSYNPIISGPCSNTISTGIPASSILFKSF